jgi:hypothetical protein
MTQTGYSGSTKAALLLDSGVLYYGNIKLGTTKGSVRFDRGEEVDEISADGIRQPIEGLDRLGFRRAIITATLLEASSTRMLQLIPGAATNTVGSVETITPPDAGAWLPSLTNIRAIFENGDGTFTEYRMPRALPKWGGIEPTDRAAAGLPVTFEARAIGTDANTIQDATYLIIKAPAIQTV